MKYNLRNIHAVATTCSGSAASSGSMMVHEGKSCTVPFFKTQNWKKRTWNISLAKLKYL